MSITFAGEVRANIRLFNLAEVFQEYNQMSIREAAMAGEAYLRNESNDSTHTPIRWKYRGLIESVQYPYINQYGVTFRIGGYVVDRMDGKQKPYGFAQEFGYHDRAGNYHEGHHMVRHAAEVAAQVYLDFMTSEATEGAALAFRRLAYRAITVGTDEGGGNIRLPG